MSTTKRNNDLIKLFLNEKSERRKKLIVYLICENAKKTSYSLARRYGFIDRANDYHQYFTLNMLCDIADYKPEIGSIFSFMIGRWLKSKSMILSDIGSMKSQRKKISQEDGKIVYKYIVDPCEEIKEHHVKINNSDDFFEFNIKNMLKKKLISVLQYNIIYDKFIHCIPDCQIIKKYKIGNTKFKNNLDVALFFYKKCMEVGVQT